MKSNLSGCKNFLDVKHYYSVIQWVSLIRTSMRKGNLRAHISINM